MNSVKKTAVAVALGTVVVSSAFAVNAQTNPFGFQTMDAGFQIVGSEGKCGEGKCGEEVKKAAEKAKEGKCGEGKCGGDMNKAVDKAKEGKCGEGKCGGDMKKAAEKVETKVDTVKKEVE
ncbi:hypothetical protein L2744_17220 [Shewanella profunda]|uniref:HvfA family oxazolone/thioamide-modified RiPP metallophore n=1 Tax=Shewanella profunda TaxID=254793 RepID=UPI00200F4A0F|nr:hypothetical protein [Shewanella profunda]MCL1091313.1 hypothetical protein [Shewanella profunda]